MKIFDERETQKQKHNKQKKQKVTREEEAIIKVGELYDFVVQLS